MKIHQQVIMPRLHGDGPKNLAMVIRKPRAPNGPMTFNTLKDAMTYIKKKQLEDEYYEG